MDIQKLAHATVKFDQSVIDEKINSIRSGVSNLQNHIKKVWLTRAIGFIDLTTLGGDDTPTRVQTLCAKAVSPLKSLNTAHVHTAAVYVYPTRFLDAKSALDKLDKEHQISRATVGGGFPSGQMPLETRVREVEIDVEMGADEIDIVINRPLVLMQQWKELYEELKAFRTAAGNNCLLKVILATGELDNLENVYKAAMVAMLAGADFIKTSTGKESVNATLPVGIVMCQAIKDYYKSTQRKVGLKPAGGIKEPQDALEWMMLAKIELGEEWLNKDLFRIGASNLLDNIVQIVETN
ncbi:deoxyribose-phosphate aldolase [Ceratina calcarata]|uniref:deoxyribose-phosphate aldolase n=1 Tax=Ceratina calcarata TaxID=156304 RepID=A0AAJ7ISU8_9HYME|nr:deoxyribose-phosphate aldolase [Ceratina calcarata]